MAKTNLGTQLKKGEARGAKSGAATSKSPVRDASSSPSAIKGAGGNKNKTNKSVSFNAASKKSRTPPKNIKKGKKNPIMSKTGNLAESDSKQKECLTVTRCDSTQTDNSTKEKSCSLKNDSHEVMFNKYLSRRDSCCRGQSYSYRAKCSKKFLPSSCPYSYESCGTGCERYYPPCCSMVPLSPPPSTTPPPEKNKSPTPSRPTSPKPSSPKPSSPKPPTPTKSPPPKSPPSLPPPPPSKAKSPSPPRPGSPKPPPPPPSPRQEEPVKSRPGSPKPPPPSPRQEEPVKSRPGSPKPPPDPSDPPKPADNDPSTPAPCSADGCPLGPCRPGCGCSCSVFPRCDPGYSRLGGCCSTRPCSRFTSPCLGSTYRSCQACGTYPYQTRTTSCYSRLAEPCCNTMLSEASIFGRWRKELHNISCRSPMYSCCRRNC